MNHTLIVIVALCVTAFLGSIVLNNKYVIPDILDGCKSMFKDQIGYEAANSVPYVPVYSSSFHFIPVNVKALSDLKEGEGTYIIPWIVSDRGIEIDFSTMPIQYESRGKIMHTEGGMKPHGTACLPVRMNDGDIEVNFNFIYFNKPYNWEYIEINEFIQNNK